jgi:hypothetical protein
MKPRSAANDNQGAKNVTEKNERLEALIDRQLWVATDLAVLIGMPLEQLSCLLGEHFQASREEAANA